MFFQLIKIVPPLCSAVFFEPPNSSSSVAMKSRISSTTYEKASRHPHLPLKIHILPFSLEAKVADTEAKVVEFFLLKTPKKNDIEEKKR